MLEDILYPALNLYQKLPASVQNAVGRGFRMLPERLRYGAQYRISLEEARAQFHCDPEQLQDAQWQKVQLSLNEAFKHVPFYRDRYREIGAELGDIRNFDDLRKLPRITKADIQKDPTAFISERFADATVAMNSGGSTGTPLEFYLHKGISRAKERAYFDEMWAWTGYDEQRTPLARLSGLKLDDGALTRYEPIRNTLYCSSYDLDAEGARRITDEINRVGARHLLGYCSTLYQYAQLIDEHGLQPPEQIEAIYLSSEPLHDYMKELLARVLGGRLQNWYGHSERLVLAPRVVPEDHYHVFPLYGHADVVDGADQPVAVGATGRIIATGVDSLAFPFIRYDTEDEAVHSGYSAAEKTRGWLVFEKILGRAIEYLYDSNGKAISITAVIYGQHLNAFGRVRRMQLHQYVQGKVQVWVEPTPEFSDVDGKEIADKISNAARSLIDVEIVKKTSIPVQANGKFKYLVQKLG